MKLADLSIRRHVLAVMLSALLILLGIIAYQRIGVDRYPNIEQPILSVSTTLTGATPDVMDASVTQVIEAAVNSVPGIDRIESSSSPGRSNVKITFNLDKNVDVAFNEIQSKVSQAQRRLPDQADAPIVAKTDANASPIIWLSLSGDRTLPQLYDYADSVIKKQLETVDGVGEVQIRGRGQRVIRVELDPIQLARYQLVASDIKNAFAREHLQQPGGVVVAGSREYLVDLDLEFHSLPALKNMVVAWRGSGVIRLEDVARVIDGEADFRVLSRVNSKPTVNLGIVRIANTNTVAIADQVLKRVEQQVRPSLPPGIELTVVSNDSVFVLDMVSALKDHLLEGTLLAALVVWLFLRHGRSTIIVSLAIPVSLLGAIALMYFLGYTFNTITLLALLLLIGVVVDDAIVVLENIYRKQEAGEQDPMKAASEGTQEVVFAIIAATLSLVAIFLPVVFLSGLIGRLFNSFAIVVSVGVLVSLFVSVTLTPMLCSRFLRVEHQHGRLYRWLEARFLALEHGYSRLLSWTLQRRSWVLGGALLIVLSSALPLTQLKSEFFPDEDEGRFMINLKTPVGSSVYYTDSQTRLVEAKVLKHPEIANVLAIIGSSNAGSANSTLMIVRLKPRAERQRSQQAVLAALRKELGGIAGLRASAFPYPRLGESRGGKLQFAITGPSLPQIGQLVGQLQSELGTQAGIGRLDVDVDLALPQISLDIDRAALARNGLSTRDVADALNLMAAGSNIARYNDQTSGTRYDIRLKGRDQSLQRAEDLQSFYLRNSSGQMVRLDTVVKIKTTLGPTQIERQNLQYSATLKGSPTIPLAQAVKLIKAAEQRLPPGYRIEMLGEARELERGNGQLVFVFGLASLLLYMVLASQFNSFMQPAIIMLAEPLAVVGGVFALWGMGHSLNVYSVIGLILLIGLVAKNSILLVDVTNQFRQRGLAVDAALTASCPQRLRPVLMTSLTVILAMLPAALGFGAGAETNAPLAVAVIGGMLSSTALTLLVIPAAYSVLENRQQRTAQ